MVVVIQKPITVFVVAAVTLLLQLSGNGKADAAMSGSAPLHQSFEENTKEDLLAQCIPTPLGYVQCGHTKTECVEEFDSSTSTATATETPESDNSVARKKRSGQAKCPSKDDVKCLSKVSEAGEPIQECFCSEKLSQYKNDRDCDKLKIEVSGALDKVWDD